jgi:transcriptional regulator with XRE-family HTH domain
VVFARNMLILQCLLRKTQYSKKKRRNMNTQIASKIKKLRNNKGFTQMQMAEKLNIDNSAYQRLESGESYSWAKYLNDLMQIFDTTPRDFFNDIGTKIVQTNCSFSDNAIGYVETLHQENKEVYEKLLQSKDEQITLLKNILEKK